MSLEKLAAELEAAGWPETALSVREGVPLEDITRALRAASRAGWASNRALELIDAHDDKTREDR